MQRTARSIGGIPVAALALITFFSFVLSFIFALGGVGSASVLIPMLTWLGVPFALARPTGLFVNTISMAGATYSNIKDKRLDFRLGIPIIVTSVFMAPAGAWLGSRIPSRVVMGCFIAFLVFSGLMMLLFKTSKYASQYREDRPVGWPAFVGLLAGFFSGLLGVGGGGLISPMMIFKGFNPKKVATITAFSVPFSSFTAFLAYAAMGSVSWKILIFAGIAAWAGGYLGTKMMHLKFQPETVKRLLACVLLLMACKLLLQLLI